MIYHICYSNPEAWIISYEKGVYGNKEKGNENKKTFWDKIIDLVALTEGDRIFFYIKNEKCLRGVFEVVSDPFYCTNNMFEDESEKYPFRFQFKEIMFFPNPIPVNELSILIEKGLIFSITTFERDANATFRSIRQITSGEGKIIEDTFLKFNPKTDHSILKQYTHFKINDYAEAKEIVSSHSKEDLFLNPVVIKFNRIPVKRSKISVVAQYENSLQGYIFFSSKRGLNNVIKDIDVNNFTECLMEVPMITAQQFRSDIVFLYQKENKLPHFYSILETKKDQEITINDLSQLIGYMKNLSESKEIPFNCIEGIYISNQFDNGAIQYLKNRKSVEKENPVRLIKYIVTELGQVSFEQIEI